MEFLILKIEFGSRIFEELNLMIGIFKINKYGIIIIITKIIFKRMNVNSGIFEIES